MESTSTADTAAQVRRARFGQLPEPIPVSAMVVEQPATPHGGDDYNPERAWLFHSCVALDIAF